jgi:hypothetical protein
MRCAKTYLDSTSLIKATPWQRQPQGEGTSAAIAVRHVPEAVSNRPGHDQAVGRGDRRVIFAATVFSPYLEGEGKYMLGGQPRREEQHLSPTKV